MGIVGLTDALWVLPARQVHYGYILRESYAIFVASLMYLLPYGFDLCRDL